MLERYKYFTISLPIWIVCKTILKTCSYVTGQQETARQVPVTIYSYLLLLIMPSPGKGETLEPVFHIFVSSESFPFKIWNSFFSWHQQMPALITEKDKSYHCLVPCVQRCSRRGLVYHSKVGADNHWMKDESSAEMRTRHWDAGSTRAPPYTAFGGSEGTWDNTAMLAPFKGLRGQAMARMQQPGIQCLHSCVRMCFYLSRGFGHFHHISKGIFVLHTFPEKLRTTTVMES